MKEEVQIIDLNEIHQTPADTTRLPDMRDTRLTILTASADSEIRQH